MRIRSWTFAAKRWASIVLVTVAGGVSGSPTVSAQAWPSYAGGPMHNAISPFASQVPRADPVVDERGPEPAAFRRGTGDPLWQSGDHSEEHDRRPAQERC